MIGREKKKRKNGGSRRSASPLEAINACDKKRTCTVGWAGCFRPCVTPRLVGTGPVGCRHIAASATISQSQIPHAEMCSMGQVVYDIISHGLLQKREWRRKCDIVPKQPFISCKTRLQMHPRGMPSKQRRGCFWALCIHHSLLCVCMCFRACASKPGHTDF